MLKPVAITVSTNFSDILPYSLKNNRDFFKHWYIVTDEGDSETIKIVEQLNDSRVSLLLYKFRGNVFTNQYGSPVRSAFDKGGAVRMAQKQAYKDFPDSWYLVLDTDILIRSWRDFCIQNLARDCIYGPAVRNDYKSLSDYKQGIIHYDRHLYKEECAIIGCFQLYYEKRYYEHSEKSDLCDNNFTNLWLKENHKIIHITVDHLGYWAPEVPNTHRGRVLGNGFKIDD